MKRFIMILASVLLIASSAFSGDGNVDGIGNIDLKDVIISLQVSAGLTPSATVDLSADVNSNGRIGLEEAIYGLQVVAQLRESAAATCYKDSDGDKYSDGTKIISATRPAGGYYKESELLAASGDPNDNDPKIFPVGGVTEITRIQTSIQTSSAGWVAATNPVSALPNDQRKKRLGAILPASIPKSLRKTYTARDNPPASFDWRNNSGNFVTPVKDQGGCGSCWAFSATAALESQVLMRTGQSKDLSEQIVVSCSSAGSCAGGSPTTVSDFLRNTGTNTESCYPYTETNGNCANACANWQNGASKIDSWAYVDNTVTNMKNAIYTSGPLITTMAVYTDFFSYTSGVYRYTWGQLEGYHAIVVVGWDDSKSCFIVKNSWDTGWGESGYYRIAYSEVTGNSEFGYLTIAYTTKASCTYSINPSGNSFASSGGTGSVNVTASGGCTWTAVSNAASWITVSSGSTGSGNGTVAYSVPANPNTTSRTGTITIAGQTFTVTQSGNVAAQYTITSSAGSNGSISPAGSVKVNQGASQTFTITPNTGYTIENVIADGVSKGMVSSYIFTNVNENHTISVTFKNTPSVVIFPDKNLEAVVRQAISKPSGDIFVSDLQGLTSLSGNNKGIVNLEGLQYCTNLTVIDLGYNSIGNISALASLTKLMSLGIYENQISDINALAGLSNLTYINLSGNQISNISALSGLINLDNLDLGGNKISNISALVGLTKLIWLKLNPNQISDIKPLVDNSGINSGDYVVLLNNTLSATSCTFYIPQLKNRGVTVDHNCP